MNTALISPQEITAQCTNCQGTTSNPRLASSAIGIHSIASGLASFASGFEAVASGKQSTGIGNMIQADGVASMIFGNNANCTAEGSMVIGKGFGEASQNRITNNIENSLMIGFNSINPTLFVSSSPSRKGTGKVGIGGVLEPQAKLHILAEHGEQAGLFIEQSRFRVIDLFLGDMNHGIRCTDDDGLIFRTGENYIFNEGSVGIGTLKPGYMLDIKGDMFTKELTLYDKDRYRESIEGWVLRSNEYGKAYWCDPSTLDDDDWIMNGNDVYRISGHVGIGTNNTYGYRLAVNGAIITEEVTVKITEDWPDYVFHDEYDLISIPELESYISENGHLPDIPAAEAIKKNGLEVGKMEGLLLQKIEELTLYIICQEEKIEKMERRMERFIPVDSN